MKQVVVLWCLMLAGIVTGNEAVEYWEMFGSFGHAEGKVKHEGGTTSLVRDDIVVTSVEDVDGGVTHRRTTLKNASSKPITATCLLDSFPLEEGDWEVYTQAGCWENESRGAWQPLNTAVEVRNPSMRTCNGSAPMIAVYNRQTGRGRVYHLLSDTAYELHALRVNHGGNRSTVRVETGMDSRQLAYRLAPGEEAVLPEVVTYEFTNRLDLDCHRLHAWWHRHFPGRRPAALYNTWLYRFDKIDTPSLLRQVERAAAMGLEYFVIDAGWFGPAADWCSVRGEWKELPNGHLGGRMAEISAAVRKAGMKFGFWVEAESVAADCSIAKEHPEWVMPGGFYDFTNPAAFEHLVETVCALLKKYEASFLKFDFNQNLEYDRSGRAFADYNRAYRRFVREIRRRNPGVYIEGCASGGYMMDMGWGREFESFWLSDNQSPHDGFRIAKETMLRLAPRQIERWIVAQTLKCGQPDYGGRDSRILATEDATWTRAGTYHTSYIDSFLAGGTPGFSCDLAAFSEDDFNHFKDYVAQFKKDAAFWQTAVGRILCDTGKVTVLQYSDEVLSDVRIVVATERVQQNSVRVFPVLDPAGNYEVDGKRRTAAEIARDGIVVGVGDCTGGGQRIVRIKN